MDSPNKDNQQSNPSSQDNHPKNVPSEWVGERLQNIFNEAVRYVKTSEEHCHISNKEKLKFYALYKQSTTGPCNNKRPSLLKVIDRMKFDAWKKYGENLTKEQAMQKYILNLKKIDPHWDKILSKL